MAKENSLAVTGEKALSAGAMEFLQGFEGNTLDNLGAEDMVFPRFKLVQNTSIKGTPGKYMSNINSEEFDRLAVTALRITKTRSMFPKVYTSGDRLLCRSNDGKTKSDPSGIGSGDCSRCQYAVWGKDAQGNTIRPECNGGYTILALAEDGSPCFISMKGTSVKPTKQLITQAVTSKIPLFARILYITSKPEVNTKGRYYVASFEFGDFHSEEVIRAAGAQYIALLDIISSDLVVDVSTDNETDAPRGGASAARNFQNDISTSSVALDDIPF